MEEKKRIKHKDMGHGTVVNESGDMYEIEWDEKPSPMQNGGRKVSSVPKDHVDDCCGGTCGNSGCAKDGDKKDCDCGADGMCSNCYDDEDWADIDVLVYDELDDEDWDDIGDLTEEELEELEEMLDNWIGGIKLCLRNKLLNKDVFSVSFIEELRKGITIETVVSPYEAEGQYLQRELATSAGIPEAFIYPKDSREIDVQSDLDKMIMGKVIRIIEEK